jgi:hypothetical protein
MATVEYRVTRSSIPVPIVLLSALAASPAAAESAFVEKDGVWQRSPHACGTPQIASVDPLAIPPPPAPGLRTVYLNRFGGTYTMGLSTNAATNTLNRNFFPTNQSTVTIPPLNTQIYDWNFISSCLRTHFMRYNVRIVEAEPDGGSYIEAVVGGNGSEIGFGGGQLFGIASADNFCNVTERGIALNFSESHNQVPRRNEELCATIAHEIGHLIALEHEQLSTDIMSYVLIAQSQTKAFVDQNSGCGTSPQDPSSCFCGGGSTNSHARIAQFIGLRDTETIPPTIDLRAPGPGPGPIQVPPTFDVIVDATDNAAMSDVVVLLNGVEVGIDTEPEGTTYQITVRGAAEGDYTLTARATDAAGNAADQEVAIVVRKLATGDACTANEACSGGLCATLGESQFCTQVCDAANACPGGFDCVDANGQGLCVPNDGGGCCSTSTDPRAALLWVLGIGILLLRPRRK